MHIQSSFMPSKLPFSLRHAAIMQSSRFHYMKKPNRDYLFFEYWRLRGIVRVLLAATGPNPAFRSSEENGHVAHILGVTSFSLFVCDEKRDVGNSRGGEHTGWPPLAHAPHLESRNGGVMRNEKTHHDSIRRSHLLLWV